MAQSGNDRTAIPDSASLREVLARFQDPLPHVAMWQIVTTILVTVCSYDTEESLVLGHSSRSYPVPICGHRRTREAAFWLVSAMRLEGGDGSRRLAATAGS